MALSGVLLDLDGTFVLSVDFHARAWVDAFAEHGYEVAFDRVRPLIGMGGDRVIPQLVPELNDEEPPGKDISDRRKALILERDMPRMQAAPGARALAERMRGDGLRLVVVSSATNEEIEGLLRIAEIADLIDETTSAMDAESSKPAPDAVQAALDKAGLRPDEVLMLGDTPYDIESAAKAGVGVIAVRSGGFPDETLETALAIYDDPAHLLREYDTSPLGRRDARVGGEGAVAAARNQ